jgi:hypothetical protein
MENTLLMRTEASYSLNFLIYLQNIYLNQNQSKDRFKYPYLPTKCEFRNDFEMRYRELWNLVSTRISEDPINDQHIFFNVKNSFYEGLFAENDSSLTKFNEIYVSFKVWWGSFAGRFAIERSFDVHGQDIYSALVKLLLEKELKPQRELDISLIYDECVFVDLEPTSYFAVLPIKEWFVNNKELISKLEVSFR